MTASKERVENPRRTRTRAHAEVTNRIHFPLLCNPLQSLPGMTNTYNVNANLPHAPRIWMLFWQISALFFPVFSVSKQFFFDVSPLSLEIRDSSYISKEKKTHHQTNHFRLQLQPVSPPAALLRCPLLSSHLYSSLPLSALSTPADAADMLLHARNDARFGSAVQSGDGKCGIPMEAGQQRRYLVTQTSSSSSSSRTCAVLLLSRPCCQNTLGSHSTLSFCPWSNLLTAI